MNILSILEISEACEVLFGPEVEASIEFLKYLQPSGLRSAYRKKALETHPDRSEAIRKDKTAMSNRFIEATLAYEKLMPLVGGNRPFRLETGSKKTTCHKKTTERQSGFSHSFSNRNIPKRKLLIGQFLYYSGLISWQTLIDAIVWQRRHRPLIGEIALDWRMLTGKEIQQVLNWKSFSEKFGERAIRLGYLSRFELMALLGKQRRLRYPIGEYFVRQGILHPKDMEIIVEKHHTHNHNMVRGKKRY